MAATIQQNINDRGVFRAVLSVKTDETPGVVYVGHLRSVTVQFHRGAGSSDTLAITGSNDNTTFAAVTSKQQAAVSSGDGGGDTALSAVSAGIHTIRQGVEYLKFTPSGDTDTFTIIVSGPTRN